MAWSSDDLAYLRAGETSFLLQKFYVRERAKFDPTGVLWRIAQNIDVG